MSDPTAQPKGFGAEYTAYGYDGNGNLISDGAKLMSIAYNRLNLPQEVTNPAGAMTFDYTFGGEKIR